MTDAQAASAPDAASAPEAILGTVVDGRVSPPVCPFLLAEGGHWRLAAPSREHRCTAFAPPAALAPEKQTRLCLTSSHPTCATYMASMAAREARLAGRGDRPTRWHLARTTSTIEDPGGLSAVLLGLILDRRRWPAIPAVILVTTLLTLAISGFRPGQPASAVATPSPVASDPTPRPTATPRPTRSDDPTPEPSTPPSPTAAPATANPTPAATLRTYRVRSGDTLSAIATRFGTTVRAIVDLNNLADPNSLSVGQVLLIPS